MRDRRVPGALKRQVPHEYTRDTWLSIRISKPERALIKRVAAAHGMTSGAYLVSLALPDGLDTVVDTVE